MNNQDKLKKLAEMAGIELTEIVDWADRSWTQLIYDDGQCKDRYWRPLEDMNQALECWRESGSRFFDISTTGGGFDCGLDIVDYVGVYGKTESEALCNALLEIEK